MRINYKNGDMGRPMLGLADQVTLFCCKPACAPQGAELPHPLRE
jgi:hypothetical protein